MIITKRIVREVICRQLSDFAKRSKDIKLEHNWYCGMDTLRIKPTAKNANVIAEIIDFLAEFDWGHVDDYQGHEFYKYDEIWYHTIDNRLDPRWDDEMEKYEDTYYYNVVLVFDFQES